MLDHVVEQRDAVTLMLAGVTSVKQWATAADLATTLRPFLDVRQIMSASSYPTVTMVIPVLDGLGTFCSALPAAWMYFATCCCASKTMLNCVWLVWWIMRFKLLPFDTPYQRDRALTSAKAAVTVEIRISSCTPSKPALTAVLSIWDTLKPATSAVPTGASAVTSEEAIKVELNNYVTIPCIVQQECLLRWWWEQQSQFPVIVCMAQQLLAAPAASVTSERLFSKAHDAINKKHNSLAPGKADMLLFWWTICEWRSTSSS